MKIDQVRVELQLAKGCGGQNQKLQKLNFLKPRLHLAEYFSDCLRWRQLSNREQSETDRYGNRFCRKEIGIIQIIF